MRNLKKQLIFGMTLLLAITFMACGSSQQKESDSTENQEEKKHKVEHFSATESKEVGDLVDAYLVLKDALVNDDEAAATKAVKQLSTAAKNITTSGDNTDNELYNSLDQFNKMADKMAVSDIKKQRAIFEEMTDTFRNILKQVGIDRTLYLQYCPMYEGNKGGYWLSDKTEIYNPLFGSAMLRCGVVKLELASKN